MKTLKIVDFGVPQYLTYCASYNTLGGLFLLPLIEWMSANGIANLILKPS